MSGFRTLSHIVGVGKLPSSLKTINIMTLPCLRKATNAYELETKNFLCLLHFVAFHLR